MHQIPIQTPIVEFNQVSFRYGMGAEILKDLSLTLDRGSFQFLTGPSGAGKTTLMRLIILALRPTAGTLNLFGRSVQAITRTEIPDIRRRMGIVFQDFRLLDHLTIYDNVALPLRVLGRPANQYRQDVIDLLDWVGLGDRLDAFPPVLSGGEQQRVAIARAVITKPELLLADEPTGNVDPTHAERLLRLFIELNRLGTTILLATHDHYLMDQFSNTPRLFLENGHVETV